jgi:ABC-type bacteriocin/lantibiotic exporter with double-glycine peptidase domain
MTADCGVACLQAVAKSSGAHVDLQQLRALADVGRDGTTALNLAKAARELGFSARGLRIPVEAFTPELAPAIAQVDDDHFVVVSRVTANHVRIMDPAAGISRPSKSDFAARYSGVCLKIEGSAKGAASKSSPQMLQYYRTWAKRSRTLLAAAWLISVVLQLGLLVVPLTLAGATRDLPDQGGSALWLASLIFVSAAGFLARNLLLIETKVRHDEVVSSGFLRHMVSLPLSYFSARATSDLMNRVVSLNSIRDALTLITVTAFADALAVVALIVLLSVAIPGLGIIVAAVCVILIATPLVVTEISRPVRADAVRWRTVSSGTVLSFVQGVEQVKAMRMEDPILRQWESAFNSEVRATRRVARVDLVGQVFSDTLRLAAGPVFLLVAFAGARSQAQGIILGLLAAAILVPITNLNRALGLVMGQRTHFFRVEDVLRELPRSGAASSHSTTTSDPDVCIRMDDITFRYPGARTPVLQHLSMEIARGELVGLIGPSGCGKTTLSRILAGMLPPESGQLEYGAGIQEHFGFATQQTVVFPGTLRENILVGREVSDTVLEAAVSRTGLGSLLDELRMGLDTPLTESASFLSGGQRQRVALARAILLEPALLVLDEATSNLDERSEEGLLDRFREWENTIILITHRQSLYARTDKLVQLENGIITAVGRPEQVMASDGPYRAGTRR